MELRFGVGEFGFVSVRETALVVIKAELEPTSVHFCLRFNFSLMLFWYSGNDFCRPACSQQLRTARSPNITVYSFKSLKITYSKYKLLFSSIAFPKFTWGRLNFCFYRKLAQVHLSMPQTEIWDLSQISSVWLKFPAPWILRPERLLHWSNQS